MASNYPRYSSVWPPNSGPQAPPRNFYAPNVSNTTSYHYYQQQSHATPNFNIPAIQQMQSHYVIQHQPPPVAQRMYQPYSTQINNTNNQLYQKQMEDVQKMQQQIAQEMKSMKTARSPVPATALPQQVPQSTAVAADQPEMKRLFVDELMRRMAYSGTFEMCEGTVKHLPAYTPEDPVAVFWRTERGSDLGGRPWNPEADCEYLRKAMKGFGTDEAAIIHVVASRANSQRQELRRMYKTMYGRDLIADLNSDLSGDFREAVMACFVPPPEYDAWCVKQAIYGLGTDELTLIEVFMTRTNAQMRELRAAYPGVVGASGGGGSSGGILEEDIRGDTSGNFRQLLISASQGNRYEITRQQLENAVEETVVNGQPTGMFHINYHKLVDVDKVRNDAQRLFNAGENRWGTDEETFNLIFSTRDFYHLQLVWSEYVKIAQRDILNSIDRETAGDYKRSLRTIVMNIRCRPMFFAERLQTAMKGLGTDDKALIRIIVSRSEIDMVQIKKCFLDLTKQTLWRWIEDDTSGDYKRLLQAIVGKD